MWCEYRLKIFQTIRRIDRLKKGCSGGALVSTDVPIAQARTCSLKEDGGLIFSRRFR